MEDYHKKAEQAKKNIQELFKKNPELKQAFKETIDEMKKPENVQKAVNDISKFAARLQDLKNGHLK